MRNGCRYKCEDCLQAQEWQFLLSWVLQSTGQVGIHFAATCSTVLSAVSHSSSGTSTTMLGTHYASNPLACTACKRSAIVLLQLPAASTALSSTGTGGVDSPSALSSCRLHDLISFVYRLQTKTTNQSSERACFS